MWKAIKTKLITSRGIKHMRFAMFYDVIIFTSGSSQEQMVGSEIRINTKGLINSFITFESSSEEIKLQK